jgi:hypothetical protein
MISPGFKTFVCTDVQSNPAAWHQFGKDSELGLARARLAGGSFKPPPELEKNQTFNSPSEAAR